MRVKISGSLTYNASLWTRFQVRGVCSIPSTDYEPKPRTGTNSEDLKSGPVQVFGFEMTSRMNIHCTELILIQSKNCENTSPDIQYHHVIKIKLFVWLISSWIINKYAIYLLYTKHINILWELMKYIVYYLQTK